MPDIVAGLDLGGGRVTGLLGVREPDSGRIRVLGGAVVPCGGLKRGNVVNISEAARAIAAAVKAAEAVARETVTRAVIGLRGDHFQSFNHRIAVDIGPVLRRVVADDTAAAERLLRDIPISGDREVLHTAAAEYSADGRLVVGDPVGMEALRLSLQAHLVTAAKTGLSEARRAAREAGLAAVELVYCPLAVGEFWAPLLGKGPGTLLIDFGGGSISLVLCLDGRIAFLKELAVGGDLLTRDIAVGLGTSLAAAEAIKIKHGIAHASLLDGDPEIVVLGMDGLARRVRASALLNIIAPRLQELFCIIADETAKSGVVFRDVFLTGGGAALRGLLEAARDGLGTPARLADPRPAVVVSDDAWLSPQYATALALVWRGLRLDGETR